VPEELGGSQIQSIAIRRSDEAPAMLVEVWTLEKICNVLKAQSLLLQICRERQRRPLRKPSIHRPHAINECQEHLARQTALRPWPCDCFAAACEIVRNHIEALWVLVLLDVGIVFADIFKGCTFFVTAFCLDDGKALTILPVIKKV